MGLIQNLLGGMSKDKKEFKEKFRQAQEENKIEKLLEERAKSSNRRELERYLREQEESQIKTELDKIRKKQNKETWSSKNKILAKGKSILKDDRPILKEKNIFVDNRNKVPIQTKDKGMFFRW